MGVTTCPLDWLHILPGAPTVSRKNSLAGDESVFDIGDFDSDCIGTSVAGRCLHKLDGQPHPITGRIVDVVGLRQDNDWA